MILPASQTASILLLVLTLICWGSWANTIIAPGKKWRFELYYFDFAIGVLIAALLAALTIGRLGWDGFSFLDDFRLAGKRQDMFAFIAGAVFNLGNMLLVAAISLTGISIGFPVGAGTSLIVAAMWSMLDEPAAYIPLRIGGMAALGASVIVAALAYKAYEQAKLMQLIQAGQTKSTRKTVNLKGIYIGIAGGVFLGSIYPAINLARLTDVGLGPYSLGFVFALGVLSSTFVFNLFFMNLPVAGKPIEMGDYFRARGSQHVYGFFGGLIWYAGMLGTLVINRADGNGRMAPAITYALTNASVIVATVWGLAYWKELRRTDTQIGYQIVPMLLFMTLGVGLLAGALALAPK